MKKHKLNGRAAPALFMAFLLVTAAGGCEFSETGGAGAEQKETGQSSSISIMTWNVQALFDGNDDGTEYDEYRHSAGWSPEKYQGRLNIIAQAISGMEAGPPDIIAMQEIESAVVLDDLAGLLSKHGYAWTHFANNPGMSLGLGILSRFPLEGTKAHSVSVEGDTTPRPVLETRISAGPEALTLFICHWKSKLGGEDATEATRRASARIILRRMRELAKQEPDIPVIIMGDLNENHDEFFRRNGAVISALLPDDPKSAELTRFFENDDEDSKPAAGERQMDFLIISSNKPPDTRYFPPEALALYSPWNRELTNGSYYYKNNWETIDHFLLSRQLFNGTGWEFEDSTVAGFEPFANSKGHPIAYNPRTGSGLSDHLPLILLLKHN